MISCALVVVVVVVEAVVMKDWPRRVLTLHHDHDRAVVCQQRVCCSLAMCIEGHPHALCNSRCQQNLCHSLGMCTCSVLERLDLP